MNGDACPGLSPSQMVSLILTTLRGGYWYSWASEGRLLQAPEERVRCPGSWTEL